MPDGRRNLIAWAMRTRTEATRDGRVGGGKAGRTVQGRSWRERETAGWEAQSEADSSITFDNFTS